MTKCCSAGPSAALPTHVQGKNSVTSVSLPSAVVSRRAGREDAEKGGLKSESVPGERFSLPLSLVPQGYPRADDKLQFVLDVAVLSRDRSPCVRLETCCVKEQGWGNPTGKLGEASPSLHLALSEQAAGFAASRLDSLDGKRCEKFSKTLNQILSRSLIKFPSKTNCASLSSVSLKLICAALAQQEFSQASACTTRGRLPRSQLLSAAGMQVRWQVPGSNGCRHESGHLEEASRMRGPGLPVVCCCVLLGSGNRHRR